MHKRQDTPTWNPANRPEFFRTYYAVAILLLIALAAIALPCSATDPVDNPDDTVLADQLPILATNDANPATSESAPAPESAMITTVFEPVMVESAIGGTWNFTDLPATGKGIESLAINLDGNPCLAYNTENKEGRPELFYAQRDGQGSWDTVRIVDATTTIGTFASLAIDASGEPRISFYDGDYVGVKYAKRTGGTWTISEVKHTVQLNEQTGPTSLKLDAAGKGHIAFYDSLNKRLNYAVEGASNKWDNTIMVDAPAVGQYPSLALYESQSGSIPYQKAGISYLSGEANPRWLKYVENAPDETPWGTNNYDTNVAGQTSVGLNWNGQLAHIAYSGTEPGSRDSQKLKFIQVDGRSKTGTTRVVDKLEVTNQVATINDLSLRLDDSDSSHIAYSVEMKPPTGPSTWSLRYAKNSFIRGWTITTIAENMAGPYSHLSLALDTMGRPYVSYYDPVEHHLKLAERTGPRAGFTATPVTGDAPLSVSFTDISTGTPTGYAWYFGDESYDQSWSRQNPPPVTGGPIFGSVLPDGSIIVTTPAQGIWRSTDQGRTWALQADSPADFAMANTGGIYDTKTFADGSILAFCRIYTLDKAKQINVYGGTSVYLSTDKGKTWTQRASGLPWNERVRTASVAMPDGSIVVAGGSTPDGKSCFQNVWLSTDKGKTWSVQPKDPLHIWDGRAGSAAVVLNDGSFLLIGGQATYGYFKDIWKSTDKGKTWTVVVPNSAPWPARADASVVALPDGSILLMGGTGDGRQTFDDLWLSRDQGQTWTQVNSGAGWTGKYAAMTELMPDSSILLMGGTGAGNVPLSEIWRMNPAGSSEPSPKHTYTTPGTYTVAQQVYNANGYTRTQKAAYITVAGVLADFTATPLYGDTPLAVTFADHSIGSPTNWQWNFGDGTTSTVQNPSHTYTSAGKYTVSLTAASSGSTNTKKKEGYISVFQPQPYVPTTQENSRSIGGTGADIGTFIQKTSDGGYITIGSTNSNDGDLSGTSAKGAFGSDIWIVKRKPDLNSQWQQRYGGSRDDQGQVIIPRLDSNKVPIGYAFLATTNSLDKDISERPGNTNQVIWVVYTDLDGNVVWWGGHKAQKCIGGDSGDTVGWGLTQVTNGDIIVVGYTTSPTVYTKMQGEPSANLRGASSAIIAVLDPNDAHLKKIETIGGTRNDWAVSVAATMDGGFIVLGGTTSNGIIYGSTEKYGDKSGTTSDITVMKYDSVYALKWSDHYGGANDEMPSGIIQTPNQDYIFVGSTKSGGRDIGGQYDLAKGPYPWTQHGSTVGPVTSDIWVVYLNKDDGSIKWQRCYGGSGNEFASMIRKTDDGKYIVSGAENTNSNGDGDIISPQLIYKEYPKSDDGYNAWVFEISPEGGKPIWAKSLGGMYSNFAFSIAPSNAQDDSVVVMGYAGNNGVDYYQSQSFHTSPTGFEYPDQWLYKLVR